MNKEEADKEIRYRLGCIALAYLLEAEKISEFEYAAFREKLIEKTDAPYGKIERGGLWKNG